MKTIIILLDNRKLLEAIENQVYKNESEITDELKALGMTEAEEEGLGYYQITDFMDLVNDQVLDNLTDTFLGYVNIYK